jgi:hypothetical protein
MIGPVREERCLFAIYLQLLLIIKHSMMDEMKESDNMNKEIRCFSSG